MNKNFVTFNHHILIYFLSFAFLIFQQLVSINMKQVKIAALTATKGRIKSWQETQHVLTVQLVGAMQVVGLLDVTRYHPDPIVGMA
jgi:hypothetical protein